MCLLINIHIKTRMYFKEQKINYKIKYKKTTILLKILDIRASVCCGRLRPPKRIEEQRTYTKPQKHANTSGE